jgi:hypothetical protein
MTDIGDSASRREWARRTNAAWKRNERQTLHGNIELGKQIVAAREALPHGEFGAMIKRDLDFGRRKAERLAVIAEHPILADATHESHLPSSWTTLYELAQIDKEILLAKINNGTITPKLQRDDVQRKILGKEKSANAARTLDRVRDLKRKIDEQQARINEQQAYIAELEAARDLSQPEEPDTPIVTFEKGLNIQEVLRERDELKARVAELETTRERPRPDVARDTQIHTPVTQPVHRRGVYTSAYVSDMRAESLARDIDRAVARMGQVEGTDVEAFALAVATRIKQPLAPAIVTAIAHHLEEPRCTRTSAGRPT